MKKLILAPALAAVLALGACGSSGSESNVASTSTLAPAAGGAGASSVLTPARPDALGISVNGRDLTVAEFDAQLDSWADLAEATGETVKVGDDYTPDFIASITNQYIRFEVFLSALEADGTIITDEDRAQAEASAATDFAGVAADDPARMLAVEWLAGLAAVEPSAAELEAYVGENTDDLTANTICSSHILVGRETEADAIASRLASGETFADLAKELSIDPGSGSAGGDLGCVALGTFVPEYEQAALQAEVDSVTDPIASEFGFHLILTRKPSTEDLFPAASAKIAEANGARITEELGTAIVELAPQFGTWDAATHTYAPPS